MDDLSLVPIGRSGHPTQPVPHLPAVAQEMCAATAKMYEISGYDPPWTGYLAVRGGECVGACSFKSAPKEGAVEIAYVTFPAFEGRGVATRMVQALLEIAMPADPSLVIWAHTRPEKNASNTILIQPAR